MENEKPNYFAIIPAAVRYDEDLTDKAKLLYGEITCLSNKEGFCFATNNYFANLYGCTTRTIQNTLDSLNKKGYIRIEIINNTQRRIYLGMKFISQGYENNFVGGYEKNFTHNNTNNNIKNNIYKKKSFKNFTQREYDDIEDFYDDV